MCAASAAGLAGGLIVAARVDGEVAEDLAGGGVQHGDVEVLDEDDDAGSGVGSADADAAEADAALGSSSGGTTSSSGQAEPIGEPEEEATDETTRAPADAAEEGGCRTSRSPSSSALAWLGLAMLAVRRRARRA